MSEECNEVVKALKLSKQLMQLIALGEKNAWKDLQQRIDKAASLLEAQAREIAGLKSAVDGLSDCGVDNAAQAENAALKAENAELRKSLEDTKRKAMQPLARYLAKQYNDGQAVEIARLCDDELDRTGNLLGWVREEAIAARRTLGGMT